MINILVDKFKTFVEQVVQNYALETNQETEKVPQVLTGFLPSKRSAYGPDFPFVIVRALKGSDASEQSTVTIRLYIGTYSEDEKNGWRDVTNIIERIRTEILKQRVIGKKFKVELPIEFEIPEEQPIPEWFGFMTLQVIVPQVQDEGGFRVVY
ncbi:hypothetical protein [Schinkia azotoformans]|uniref:hypothetical protein n=1 Tax=Schinkia azotoformans TaxID=1454 RepID=UPI002DBB6710|nr:hypothetical protein [Schinkia azotoformans]MEC1744122.1 hypothetical protein [Schinkia azotoformans]